MNLHQAAVRLADFLENLSQEGYDTWADKVDEAETLKVGLRDDPDSGVWFEVNRGYGYWQVSCSSGPEADKATADVTVPRSAFRRMVAIMSDLETAPVRNPEAVKAMDDLRHSGLVPDPELPSPHP